MTLRRTLCIATLSALSGMSVRAAAPVDADLLEFLGSLDGEDEGWQEYLEQKPVPVKVPVPPKAAPPLAGPDSKQVRAK
jgi:hypothetical protein